MKKAAAVGCWVVAVALGVGTGHYALPARTTVHWPGAANNKPSASTTPGQGRTSAPPETLPTDYAKTPPTERNFASVKDFSGANFSVRVYAPESGTSPTTGATLCSADAAPGATTFGDLTGYDPTSSRTWQDNRSDSTADQTLLVADSPAKARTAADQLLHSLSPCRHEPIGHWVFGEPEQKLIAPGVWAAWVPQYEGKDNVSGSAPTDAQPIGGELIVRNGERFSVLDVFLKGDTDQFGKLAVAAAERLG